MIGNQVNYDNLLYRRQFLLARTALALFDGWKCHEIDHFYLYTHPDLEVTMTTDHTSSLILIGYIFDPNHPKKTNENILTDISALITTHHDLTHVLKSYVGRYALLYRDAANFTIRHDLYGVREIYYYTKPNRVVCGSQPGLLSKYSEPQLGFSQDPHIQHFYNIEMKAVRLGRLWVGDDTYFHNIKHLTPNHYLDIFTLTAQRYWPDQKLEKMDLDTAIERSCTYLQGVMHAVTDRFSVMMAVTAGYDSRSLLAASKDMRDQIYYFINKEVPLDDTSPDIYIPKAMFKKLDIPFHIHDVSGAVDDQFKKIYLHNCFWAQEKSLPTIYNVYFKKLQDKINLLAIGEPGREYYGHAPSNLDEYFLARCLKYKKSAFATRQCAKWLKEVKGISKEKNIDIMKLFLIEMLVGYWGAIGNAESDIAMEEFNPYSSHYIIEIMLSYDRRQGDLFKGMFDKMWPELNNFPLNPPDSMSEWLKQIFRKTKLFTPLQRLVYRTDRWKYKRAMVGQSL